jgi:hypothetical protein
MAWSQRWGYFEIGTGRNRAISLSPRARLWGTRAPGTQCKPSNWRCTVTWIWISRSQRRARPAPIRVMPAKRRRLAVRHQARERRHDRPVAVARYDPAEAAVCARLPATIYDGFQPLWADDGLLVQGFHHQRQNDRLISVRDFALTVWWSAARNGAGVGVGAQLRLPSSAVCV